MKKLFSLMLAVFLFLSVSGISAYAVETPEIKIKARSAVLMDVSSGEVLYAMNENERLYHASAIT